MQSAMFSTGIVVLEEVALTVANECDVFAISVFERDTEDFAGGAGALEYGADKGTLVRSKRLGLA